MKKFFFQILFLMVVLNFSVFSQMDKVIFKALNSNDIQVKNAVKLLMSEGYLKTENIIESRKTSYFDYSNCIFILKEDALRGGFVKDITSNRIKQLQNIDIKLNNNSINVMENLMALFL